ncbi:MAG: hypothetical protein ACOC0P_02905 [Planctomycetota bacterium]
MLIHGGPGAPGCMASPGEHPGEHFHVVEPFQRTNDETGGHPLTVARHIEDLNSEIADVDRPTVLIGSSWGAMLALAYAAAAAPQTTSPEQPYPPAVK